MVWAKGKHPSNYGMRRWPEVDDAMLNLAPQASVTFSFDEHTDAVSCYKSVTQRSSTLKLGRSFRLGSCQFTIFGSRAARSLTKQQS